MDKLQRRIDLQPETATTGSLNDDLRAALLQTSLQQQQARFEIGGQFRQADALIQT